LTGGTRGFPSSFFSVTFLWLVASAGPLGGGWATAPGGAVAKAKNPKHTFREMFPPCELTLGDEAGYPRVLGFQGPTVFVFWLVRGH